VGRRLSALFLGTVPTKDVSDSFESSVDMEWKIEKENDDENNNEQVNLAIGRFLYIILCMSE
jgi:hypothetical protein